MPRVNFMDRGADTRPAIEALQPLLFSLCWPIGFDRSHVEKRLLGNLLIGARRIHGSAGQCALKWWRFFDNRRHLGRYGDDLLFFDKLLEAAEGVAKRRQQLVCRRVVVL